MKEIKTTKVTRMAYPYTKDLKKNLLAPPLYLVKVTWLDAATYNDGWHEIDDLPIELDYFDTYGIHFMSDKECIYLTDTVREDRCVGTIHQIPKGMVKTIEKIREVKQNTLTPEEKKKLEDSAKALEESKTKSKK